ncbi:hypothetical protein PPGU19_095450 (plasmid) [Paraburkholderia sp. PGU19]|nr:hypothetical protein PPGU19_095450 [Paraburkholderia sp. PGU19]
MLAAAARARVGNPGGGGLRIGEEALVAQTVLVGEGRERLAQLHERPQQQPFGLLAIVVEGGLFVGEPCEPRADRLEIVRRGELRDAARGAVGPGVTVECGRDHEPFQRGGVQPSIEIILSIKNPAKGKPYKLA